MAAPPAPPSTNQSRRATPPATHLLIAFIAGFIAVLAFQQGLRAALVATGAGSTTPYSLRPAMVTGVPKLLARGFWGGIWGIVLALIEIRLPRRPAYMFWVAALVFGAVVPSLFAWFILAPIKGQALAAGGNPTRIAVALATNAVWGIGTAALYRLALRVRRAGVRPTTSGEISA